MSVELFLILLITSTILTILLTDVLKKLLISTETQYRTHAVVLDSAMVCCTGVSVVYRIPFGLGFEPILIVRLVLIIICTWFVSMVAYDKIKQTKKQYKEHKENKKGVTA